MSILLLSIKASFFAYMIEFLDYGDQIYGFGYGKRGQLGIINKVKSINLPQSVTGLKEVNVSSIIANGDHSAALSG